MSYLQEKQLRRLKETVKRLDSHLNSEPMAPTIFILHEVNIIFEAALLLFPEDLPSIFFENLILQLKANAGICNKCNEELTTEDKNDNTFNLLGICKSCSEKLDSYVLCGD